MYVYLKVDANTYPLCFGYKNVQFTSDIVLYNFIARLSWYIMNKIGYKIDNSSLHCIEDK